MSIVLTIILAVQMLSALGMIGLILVQHGKGADMGAAFGSGGSGSLFGASGSANFLSRSTGVLAALFFACTLMLAYFGNSQPRTGSSVLDRTAPATAPTPPASGAGQIPGTTIPAAPAASAPTTPSVPVVPASGAGQIPTK
jgi:preprotein translocase subunit SecG